MAKLVHQNLWTNHKSSKRNTEILDVEDSNSSSSLTIYGISMFFYPQNGTGSWKFIKLVTLGTFPPHLLDDRKVLLQEIANGQILDQVGNLEVFIGNQIWMFPKIVVPPNHPF